jgi:hypothetical protein
VADVELTTSSSRLDAGIGDDADAARVKIRYQHFDSRWTAWSKPTVVQMGDDSTTASRLLDYWYFGHVPVRGLRIQIRLVDRIDHPRSISQTLDIVSQ